MSILQEYEQIRKGLGEDKYLRIEEFLSFRHDLDLSDVYYKPDVFAEFERYECWLAEVSKLSAHEIEKKITAAELSVDFVEAQMGVIENDESLVGATFDSKVSDLEAERVRCQAKLESLWKIRNDILSEQQGACRINRQSPNKDESEMER